MIIVILAIILAYIYLTYIRKKRICNYIRPIKYLKSIPKVIIRKHSFDDENRSVPYSMYNYCHEKWIKLNPDYSMIWYNDTEANLFMEKMGDRINNAYKKIKPGAYKSDLWRACFLYTNGGVYIDSYTMPYISLSLMLQSCFSDNRDQFISAKDVDHMDTNGKTISGIHNGFMIATKNHPFFKQYIEDMVVNIESNYYGNHFLDITGPFCLMRSINKVNNNYIDKKPKVGWNKGKYDFYLFKFRLDINQNISKNGIDIMCKKYSLISLFHEKILKRRKLYSVMWNNRNVYN